MAYATVRIGGLVIPLIGIPEEAGTETCNGCGQPFHLQDIKLQPDGRCFLCEDCQRKIRKMKQPTLDEFIVAYGQGKYQPNLYVKEKGFRSLYVRIGKRWIGDVWCDPTLDLASLTASRLGHGTFTALVKRLRRDYPAMTLYVESVSGERFCAHLRGMGFVPMGFVPMGPALDCFALVPGNIK